MPRGAHVPVCPGHDVGAGPGGAGGLRRAQDRPGGATLRPGEVRAVLLPALVLTQCSPRNFPHTPLALSPNRTQGPPVLTDKLPFT